MTKDHTRIAASIVSTINNAMEVIKSWYEKRDRKLTGDLLAENKKKSITGGNTPYIGGDADAESLNASFQKIDTCFKWYQTVLASDANNGTDIDDAAKRLITCIGEELAQLEGIAEEPLSAMIKQYGSNREDDGDDIK